MDLLAEFSSDSSSFSSASDDDGLEMVENLFLPELLQKKVKNENYAEETVPLYSDEQFIQHFRISRNILDKLKTKYENSEYYPKKDTGFKRIGSEKCILAFLWYASNEASSVRDIADRFNMSVSTLHSVVNNVVKFLSDMSEDVIVWPSLQEAHNISAAFEVMGFSGVIGCIDGTHIRIDTPNEDADSYLNRKKYHSIQMQIVCDNKKIIRDIFIGYPGSVHDARVFRNSPLAYSIRERCRDYIILGDSAYPCLRNLLTPFKDTGNLSQVEKNYNKKLSHCRVLVEHTIGLLKQRFRQLYHLKSKDIEFICHFIRACCVLHNLCVRENLIEDVDFEIPEIDIVEENVAVEEQNEVGLNYRNYVAALLNI